MHFIMLFTRALVQQGLYTQSRYSKQQCTSLDEIVCTLSSHRPCNYSPGSFSFTAALGKTLVRHIGWGGFVQSKVGCTPWGTGLIS